MKTKSFSLLLLVTILASLLISTVPCTPAMASAFPGKIVFTASEGSGQIYLMNPNDGSGLVNLSNNTYSEGLPQLSHDGTRVVYNRSVSHNPNYVITNYIMNVDGTGTPLALGYTNSNSTYPVWSTDDSKIAYVHHNAISQDDNIFTTTSDGSSTVQVTNLVDYTITSITWGSNHKIAFQAKESGPHIVGDTSKPWQIWCIDDTAVNGSPVLLIDNPSVLYFDPEYSPDGTKIAFTYCINVGQGNSGLIKDLGIAYLSNPSNTINIYQGATTADPSWSPDGTALAFAIGSETLDWDGRINQGKIHRINIDKTDRVNLSTRWGSDSWPIWDFTPMWGTEPHATHLQMVGPSSCNINEVISFSVTARDNSGNLISGYTGTVHFTSTDSAAMLPADYTFTGGDIIGDNGVHTFDAALKTNGPQSITVTDTNTASGLTASLDIVVNALDTSIGIVSSKNPSNTGDSVTFTAAVSPVPDGGTIQFAADGVDFGATVAVNIADGTAISIPISTLVVDSHTITATFSGSPSYHSTVGSLTQYVGITSDVTNTSVSEGGASASQSDGVSTTITDSSLPDGTDITISSVYYGNTQPSGTGSILLNGSEYYDIQIDPAVDGTAHISLTNASVKLYTVMQYCWYGTWYDVANNEVTGPNSSTGWYTVSGDIPVEYLSGTPVAIGEYYARTWFLDSETKLGPEPGSGPDTRTELPPGFYEMEKATGPDNDGQSGTVDVNNGLAITWISDQQAEADVDLSGIWTFNLATSDMWGCHITLGEWDGVSTFSPFYATYSEPDEHGIMHFTADISAAVVPTGHYLALVLDYSGSTGEIYTDGQSYIVSPTSDPGYPVPETPAIILLAIGLAGTGVYWLISKKRITRASVIK